jgi:hypothetical protein
VALAGDAVAAYQSQVSAAQWNLQSKIDEGGSPADIANAKQILATVQDLLSQAQISQSSWAQNVVTLKLKGTA